MTPTEIIDHYCSVWCEPDAAKRAALLAPIWAPGATYSDPAIHPVGAEGLLGYIATMGAKYPGARIERTSAVDLHHDVGRFAWRASSTDGSLALDGIDIAFIDPDRAQITRIIGFFGPLTAS